MKTQNERGILNNFATEPALYFAEYPSAEQQLQYKQQGALAIALVSGLMGLALIVS
jgi:hypothetical protein